MQYNLFQLFFSYIKTDLNETKMKSQIFQNLSWIILEANNLTETKVK